MSGFMGLLLSGLLVWVTPAHAGRRCLAETYRSLVGLKGYPKVSKVDGTKVYTPHEYIEGMKNNSRWKPFVEYIQKVREEYAPRLEQRHSDYVKNKESNPALKPPGFGYERMKRDADKMAGKTIQEAFEKFNPGSRYTFHSDGAKIIISPQNKVVGQEYVEILYDVSGNYFRLQKGRFQGGRRLSFLSDHRRYIDWSGELINTERVHGRQFHELMEKTHWNALVE